MPRPTLLVAEPEPSQALSVRKLVLETAKFNVLTAHSTREALDLFHMFPNISAAVLVGETAIDCDAIAQHIKQTVKEKIPIIRITNNASGHVFYARTHDHSTMAVAYHGISSTHFDVPAGIETGASKLEVVANGIPSAAVNVTVQ